MTDNHRLHKEESNILREENSGKYANLLLDFFLALYVSVSLYIVSFWGRPDIDIFCIFAFSLLMILSLFCRMPLIVLTHLFSFY